MNLLLTAVFENGFCELYLPSVNNKTMPLEIKPSISGQDEDITLPLEVWDGVWAMGISQQFTTTEQEKPVGRVLLRPGQLLNCELRSGEVFSLTVSEVTLGNTQFTKYLLPADLSAISIGSDQDSMIRSFNRFVSPRHARILRSGETASIEDLSSVNGTFVNGRMLTGKRELKYGDVIYIIGLKIVYLGNILAVNNPENGCTVQKLRKIQISASTPLPEDVSEQEEEHYFLRTPRRLEVLDQESFSIEKCPPAQKQKRPPLLFTIGPSFTMVIPMAVGAMMTMGENGLGMAGLMMSGGAAAIGAVWAILNDRYQKKEEQLAEAHRIDIYNKYLRQISDNIQQKMDYNRSVLENRYPSVLQAAAFGTEGSTRLWEKSSTHSDFMDVRLGVGTIPSPNEIQIAKAQAIGEHDDLNDQAEKIRSTMSELTQVPVSLDLDVNQLAGIVSQDRSKALELARVLTVQLAAAHPYTDVRMCVVFPPKETDQWNFARYLPHVWTPDGKLRMMCCDASTVGDVMYSLTDVIRERLERTPEPGTEEKRVLPHYLILAADWSLLENEPIAKYLLNPQKEMGITTILLADTLDKLPSTCTTIIRDDDSCHGFYHTANAFPEQINVTFDRLPLEQADSFARSLSNYHVRELGGSTEIPDILTFLDMYHTSRVEDLDMYHKWLENRTYESMKSLIGYKAGNQPLYLDIHEKYHGPHGLVAGTTGSGKSETLQSYMLSLMVNYHPHEVAFIIIDYKGGGMAQSFVGAPHLCGVITNLGGNATNRALLSINAEIRHRQQVFNAYKVKHIDAYIELYRSGAATEPMPHLLIIADEFAELKKEQPEFVRALVSAARVGRSLGINLILATQKPSGVVDDEIWSNTRFRLCLRVADKQDSNEMLKRPDAARITGTGRGFFQVGNDEIFEEFQSGWSGAAYEPEIPFTDEKNISVTMINLIGKNAVPKKKKKKKSDNIQKVTQLDAVVQYAAQIAREHQIPALRQIWLEPLPRQLYLEDLPQSETRSPLCLPLGLADSPNTQSQYPVDVDFLRDGNVLICGPSGSGKTTLLQTMLYGAVTDCPPEAMNLYIWDFSSRTMTVFQSCPQVGAVCFDGDNEKIAETIETLQETLAQRKTLFSSQGIGSFKEYITQKSNCPAIVLVIDNFTAFSESYPEYEDAIALLSREGASYGIYLVVTCNGSGDLRSRIRQNFPTGIGLQLPDRFEYEAVVGGRTEIVPEERIPGRGLIKAPMPIEFQTALALRTEGSKSQAQALRELLSSRESTGGPKKIGAVLDHLTQQELLGRSDYQELPASVYALGLNIETQALVTADFDQEYCYSISGGIGTGKTNLLRSLALQGKRKGCRLYLFDSGKLAPCAEKLGFDAVVNDDASLFSLMEQEIVPAFSSRNVLVNQARDAGASIEKALKNEKRILFFIDDMTAFLQAVYSEAYQMSGFFELALEKGMSHKIQFIAAITPDEGLELARYQVMRQFTGFGRGVHLGGLFDQQNILHFDLSAADNVRRLGPGIAYAQDQNGAVVRMMTALTQEDSL